jgi:hypothetical protein
MKKGAVELTLNTIVIVIFAVIFLGLGTFLIRNYMARGGELIQFPEPAIEASANEPVVLGFDSMDVKRNSQAQFTVGFYNTNNESVTIRPQISACVPEGLSNVTQSIDQTVEVEKAVKYKVIFNIPKAAQSQKYVCNLVIGEISKQFSVQVQ